MELAYFEKQVDLSVVRQVAQRASWLPAQSPRTRPRAVAATRGLLRFPSPAGSGRNNPRGQQPLLTLDRLW